MKPNNQHFKLYQTGFSLVEIMVGLVIGLLATLVVLQVFSVFEGQKRTTTGSADAQTSGNVALYEIKRDLQMAGYGLLPITDSPLECTTPNFDTADTGLTSKSLTPVTITDGGTAPGASDIVTIRFGTSETGGSFSKVSDIGTAGPKVATVDDYLGCKVNDIALVISGTGGGLCSLTTVSALSPSPNFRGITLTDVSTMGAANGAFLSCLGNWKEIQYSINPNYDPTTSSNSQAYMQRKETTFPIPAAGNPAAVPSVVDIVNIQAQYGISASASSNQIIRWVNPKNLVDWNTAIDGASTGVDWGTNLTDADRNLIKGVRIAVVARNGLLEKTDVTTACSSISGNAPTGLCAWEGTSAGTAVPSWAPVIDLSNDPDWKRYRYRVYETIIPLRNVIWSKNTL